MQEYKTGCYLLLFYFPFINNEFVEDKQLLVYAYRLVQ